MLKMTQKTLFRPLAALLFHFLVIISPSHAKELWSDNSVTLLYGTTYELPMEFNPDDRERYIITLTHMSANSWGDLFSFIDVMQSLGEGEPNSLYGEFTPRFTLLPLFKEQTKQSFKQHHLTDFTLATTLEYGAAANGFDQQNYLIGPGFNFDVPHFKLFEVDLFRRFNQRWQDDFQATFVWLVPFNIKDKDFVFDGWADYETPVGSRPYNLHTQIQLRWDAGKEWFHKNDTFYLGTEYRYWRNKLGLLGVEESVWQLMVQVHF